MATLKQVYTLKLNSKLNITIPLSHGNETRDLKFIYTWFKKVKHNGECFWTNEHVIEPIYSRTLVHSMNIVKTKYVIILRGHKPGQNINIVGVLVYPAL